MTAALTQMRKEQGGQQRFADSGVGAGDENGSQFTVAFHALELTTNEHE